MLANHHFSILYQDDSLVVIDKPSGWLVHRSEIDRHETRIVVQALRNQLGRHVFPAHRLDKGTSGCLLVCFSSETASALGKQFEASTVKKAYLAVVRGYMDEEGFIDQALEKIRDDRDTTPHANQRVFQQARTDFRRLAQVELPIEVEGFPSSRYSLVQLQPQTGRQHQIRRHLKHLSHPIIGDSTYGRGRHNRMFAERYGEGRLLLACTYLAFSHPVSNEPMEVRCPLGGVFERVVSDLFGERLLDQGLQI